jgi:hypothetical protein
MLLPNGEYCYEERRSGSLIAIEQARVHGLKIEAARQAVDGLTRLHAAAELGQDGTVVRIDLRYASSLFSRDAHYRADGENFRGNVSAMAGRNEIVIKRGRFGEVDAAGLIIFRALLLARVRARGQPRWTGRVAVIDPAALAAASLKQTCRKNPAGSAWIYEARMGDTEEIDLDNNGIITRSRDSRGGERRLRSFEPNGP